MSFEKGSELFTLQVPSCTQDPIYHSTTHCHAVYESGKMTPVDRVVRLTIASLYLKSWKNVRLPHLSGADDGGDPE